MKNRLLYSIIFFISISLNSIAIENKLEVSNIELANNGEIIANDGKYISEDKKLEIIASKFFYDNKKKLLTITDGKTTNNIDKFIIEFDKSTYDENKLILSAKGNIKAKDYKNNLFIESKQILFDRKNDYLVITGNVKIFESNHGYKYLSEKISIDRKKNIIKSDEKTIIQDKFNNILSVSKFKLNLDKNVIKIINLNFEDIENNNLSIDSAQIDISSNKLFGKDIAINLNNLTFDKENQPRIKGRSISYNKNSTEVSKGVFTACKKTENCPPWELSAEKIKHDKLKKTISYEDVWLKLYDRPVLYFPKFFHPDPTVKRQSGFLMPSFKTTLNNNTYLGVPYFKALSHDKDLTFTPRFYAKDQFLFQTEYRKITKNSKSNSDFSVSSEKGQKFKGHFFHNSSSNLDFLNFEKNLLNVRFESSSNNTYLKGNDLKSPLINNYDLLESSIELNLASQDLDIKSDIIVFENLNINNNSDKYHYILPRINLTKTFKSEEVLNGNFTFNSNNIIQNYETNIWEKDNTNDLIFKSSPRITGKGFYNEYEFLIKNVNSNSQNSLNYKNGDNFYLSGLFQFNSSMPLIKNDTIFNKILTPKISLKISPSNNTRDVRNDDSRIDVNNIYALNRLSGSNTVEGGTSLTYGVDYSILNKSGSSDIFSFKFANNLRLKEHDDLPNISQLGSKTSNFVAETKFKPNKYLDMNYNISTKNNLHDLNYENLSTELKINNFITSFDYLNENYGSEKNSYLLSKAVYQLNENNSFSFSTRDNKKTSLTEYYDMMYQYKNDCLTASIEYRKNYYNDRDIKPKESIFLKLSIIPFGETSTPNLKK
jgi:LPS-assembly protein